MEIVKSLKIPIIADSVLSPDVYYGEITGIYFQTHDGQFGRITFENLDALKICRGEIMPYNYKWGTNEHSIWIFIIENSKWQKERYIYEKKNYGKSYEFGGNVDEMLTDFKHYLFSFHDQFIEVIARGFWFEKAEINLFRKPLQEGHPFLNLSDIDVEKFVAYSLTCQIRRNDKTDDELIYNAKFCSQKLIEFALELDGRASVNNSLILSYRNGKLISSLRDYFGRQIVEFGGLAKLSEVKPYIEKYIREVYERRRAKGK